MGVRPPPGAAHVADDLLLSYNSSFAPLVSASVRVSRLFLSPQPVASEKTAPAFASFARDWLCFSSLPSVIPASLRILGFAFRFAFLVHFSPPFGLSVSKITRVLVCLFCSVVSLLRARLRFAPYLSSILRSFLYLHRSPFEPSRSPYTLPLLSFPFCAGLRLLVSKRVVCFLPLFLLL